MAAAGHLHRGRAAAVTAASALLAFAPAVAGAWERPVLLGRTGEFVQGPEVATGPAGALVAWADIQPSPIEGDTPLGARVWAVVRPAGAPAWPAATAVSPGDELGFAPASLAGADGPPQVTWSVMRRGVADVTAAAAVRHAAGWAVAPADTEMPGPWAETVRAAGPDGSLVVVERDSWDDEPVLRVRLRSASGAWGEPEDIVAVDHDMAAVAVTADGTVWLAWATLTGSEDRDGLRTRLVVVTRDAATGMWDTPREGPVHPGAPIGVSLLPSGDGVTAVWARRDAATPWPVFHTSDIATIGDLGAERLRRVAMFATVPPAAGADGRQALAWLGPRGVRIATRRTGQAWSAARDVPAGSCVTGVEPAAVAVGPAGEVLVMTRAAGAVRAAVLGADGAWRGPVWLSGFGAGAVQGAVGADGTLHVAWSRVGPRRSGVEAASSSPEDAAAPGLADPVPAVTGLRVVGRGARRAAVFRVSAAGPVAVWVVPSRQGLRPRMRVARVPRGRNRVALPSGMRPGPWAVRVQPLLPGGREGACTVSARIVVRP